MPDLPLTAEDVRQLDTFLEDERDVKAALVHARRFATKGSFNDRQEAGEAADAIKVLNLTVKAADARRLETTKPFRAATGIVNTEYAELLSTIKTAAIPALKRKAVQFAKDEREREEAERKAEQDRLDKEAEEKAAASQKAAERAAEEHTPEARQEAAEAFQRAATAATATAREVAQPKGLRGGYGSFNSYVKWKCEVIEPVAIPREHLIPNLKSLQAAVDAEAKMAKAQDREFKLEIPGVRIYSEEIGVSR